MLPRDDVRVDSVSTPSQAAAHLHVHCRVHSRQGGAAASLAHLHEGAAQIVHGPPLYASHYMLLTSTAFAAVLVVSSCHCILPHVIFS
jgi:hypothetical protein